MTIFQLFIEIISLFAGLAWLFVPGIILAILILFV